MFALNLRRTENAQLRLSIANLVYKRSQTEYLGVGFPKTRISSNPREIAMKIPEKIKIISSLRAFILSIHVLHQRHD